MTSADKFLEGVMALAHLRVVLPPSRHWLVETLQNALSAAYSDRPAPSVGMSDAQRRRERDRHIRAAFAMLDGKPRPRAERLAKLVTEYSRSAWLRDRKSATCPERIDGTVEGCIWRAMSIRPNRFPSSWRHLLDICHD